ncbi:hypothetical protein HNR34_000012 [Geobacillus subterraneus]
MYGAKKKMPPPWEAVRKKAGCIGEQPIAGGAAGERDARAASAHLSAVSGAKAVRTRVAVTFMLFIHFFAAMHAFFGRQVFEKFQHFHQHFDPLRCLGSFIVL